MVSLVPLLTPNDDLDTQPYSYGRTRDFTGLEPGFDEFVGAAYDEGQFFNPLSFIEREVEIGNARVAGTIVDQDEFGFPIRREDPDSQVKRFSADEWRNSQYFRPGLSFEDGVKETVAQVLADQFDERQEFEQILNESQGGFVRGATRIGVGFAAGLTDPLNLATGFIPVIGSSRYAALAARVGVPTSRFIGGAIEGAAGAALIEPILLGSAANQQIDYGFEDSLLNIAFGAALGGGFNLAGRAAIDYAQKLRASGNPVIQAIDESAPGTHKAAVESAVAQVLRGERVDVTPVIGNDPKIGGIVRATPRQFERLQRTISDIETGKIPTRKEMQRILSTAEFGKFKSRVSQLQTETKSALVPVKTKAAEAFTRAATTARRALNRADTPNRVEKAQRAQEKAEKLFQRLPDADKAAFTKIDGDPLPRRRTQKTSKEQSRAVAAREILDEAIETRLAELEATQPRINPAVAADRPIQSQLAREGRGPLNQSETVQMVEANRQTIKDGYESLPVEPQPPKVLDDAIADLEKDIQDVQAQVQQLEDASPGLFDPADTAEIRKISDDINRLNESEEAITAGILCLVKNSG